MIQLSCLSLLCLCATNTITTIDAFHVGSRSRISKDFSMYAEPQVSNKKATFKEPEVPKSTAPPSVTTDNDFGFSLSMNNGLAAIDAKTMNEGIFNFNKQLIDTIYDVICLLYPVQGDDRDFARFYVLETVARVPYFAYLSVLHLRQTFGERYPSMSERMRTHYAEADNELHHLLIMESLGGNSKSIDRTLAQTMAFFYYWYVVVIYVWNEPAAYHMSELIEDHAFDTYSDFVANHEDMLKAKPVPAIARKYYEEDNPFIFDLYCTVEEDPESGIVVEGPCSSRRPKLESLYDVFVCIREDEKEHWKTLCNLVQFDEMDAVYANAVKSTEPATAESSRQTAKTTIPDMSPNSSRGNLRP